MNAFNTNNATNIETKTPMPKVKAKPCIKEVPNQNKTAEIIKDAIFESLIESQARAKAADIASFIPLPAFISSFNLSNMSTLASTAIPKEIINPAIPEAVRVTGINLNKVKTINI